MSATTASDPLVASDPSIATKKGESAWADKVNSAPPSDLLREASTAERRPSGSTTASRHDGAEMTSPHFVLQSATSPTFGQMTPNEQHVEEAAGSPLAEKAPQVTTRPIQGSQVSSNTSSAMASPATIAQVPPTLSAAQPGFVLLSSSAEADHRPWTMTDIGTNAISSLLYDPAKPRHTYNLQTQLIAPIANIASSLTSNVANAFPLGSSGTNAASSSAAGTRPSTSAALGRPGDPGLQEEENQQNTGRDRVRLELKDFEGYLNDIKESYERYEYNRMVGLSEVTTGVPTLFTVDEQVHQQQDAARYGGTMKRSRKKGVKPTQIPAVFMADHFDLAADATFQSILDLLQEETAAERPGTGRPSGEGGSKEEFVAAEGGHLSDQEKADLYLKHHLHTAEHQLIDEIAKRSGQFFSALTQLQALQKDTVDSVSDIRDLKAALKDVASIHASKGLEVIKLKTRKKNLQMLDQLISLLGDLQNTQPTIQALLHQSDYVGALELITEAHQVLRGRQQLAQAAAVAPPTYKRLKHVPATPVAESGLQSLHCLRHYEGQLVEMADVITNLMMHDVSGVLIQHLTSHLSDTSAVDASWATSITDAFLASVPKEQKAHSTSRFDFPNDLPLSALATTKERLTPVVWGLLRMDKMGMFLHLWRESIVQVLKQNVREALPDIQATDASSAGPNAATLKDLRTIKLRQWSFDDFFTAVRTIERLFLRTLWHTRQMQQLLGSIVSEAQSSGILLAHDRISSNGDEAEAHAVSTPLTATSAASLASPLRSAMFGAENTVPTGFMNYTEVHVELSRFVFGIAEYAFTRLQAVISSRAEQNANLNSFDFLRFHKTITLFIEKASMNEQVQPALKVSLVSQTKKFLDVMHQQKLKLVSDLLYNEKWEASAVLPDFQILFDRIIQGGDAVDRASPSDAKVEGEGSKGHSQVQIANGEKCFVTSSALVFVKELNGYLDILAEMPMMATDILTKMAEAFKLFHSETSAMVLGARAARPDLLKTIGAKHLSVSEQTLRAVGSLLPHVKSILAKYLTETQSVLLQQLDSITRLYAEHRENLYAKLVDIMKDRASFQCKTLFINHWDDKPGNKSLPAVPGEASKPVQDLIKEASTLQKVISRYLDEATLQMVMQRVVVGIYDVLSADISRLPLYTETGRQRMLVDAEAITSGLSPVFQVQDAEARFSAGVKRFKLTVAKSFGSNI